MAEQTVYISTGAHADKAIALRFADGEHLVPGWVVARLGAEELRSDPAGLAAVTFAVFMQAFIDDLSGSYLRSVQESLVGQHFGRFR